MSPPDVQDCADCAQSSDVGLRLAFGGFAADGRVPEEPEQRERYRGGCEQVERPWAQRVE